MTTCIAGLYDSQNPGLPVIDRYKVCIHYSETRYRGKCLDDIQS